MTFGQVALIKIGQLFLGRDGQHDTAEIAEIMGCTEGEIYNALTVAREAYRARSEAPPVDRKTQKAKAITRWTARNKAINAELRREARI